MANTIVKVTSVLPVASVEESLPFWQALGFEVTVSIPDGSLIGFVILVKDATEVMLQSFGSIGADQPVLAQAARRGASFVFIEVADLSLGIEALAAFELISPRRETFYGSTEATWREPSGHLVTLAQFPKPGNS